MVEVKRFDTLAGKAANRAKREGPHAYTPAAHKPHLPPVRSDTESAPVDELRETVREIRARLESRKEDRR